MRSLENSIESLYAVWPFRLQPSAAGFRSYSLDGARLFFHPGTGTSIRVCNAATARERRRAPRVAMFGITNACNLACDFCSRDVARKSAWNEASAYEALKGLSDAGTLEVAFGGGEPFAFRGFAALVARLSEGTPLALHVTTNGTLITEDRWPAFANRFGQVRLSIYDDCTWRRCASLFARTGQRWGVNLLVEDATLVSLAAQLREFADAGCHDVSLLSYVGEAKERALSEQGRRQLAEIVNASPLPCRLSVCMGDVIPVERLFAGIDNDGDCGAGYDFISITPDQEVQGCSFQETSTPATTANEILSAWSLRRARFSQPSPRRGCARTLPLLTAPRPLPSIAIWQGFSGNNSGECILVAKFSTADDAEKYLEELMPGFVSEQSYSAEWKEHFANERVATPLMSADHSCEMPTELAAIGRTAIAIGYGSDDNFPELRALAWKRGAFALPGGIHVHDSPTALLAVLGKNTADVHALVASNPTLQTYPHGDVLLATIPMEIDGPMQSAQTLKELKEQVACIAGDRRFALELANNTVSRDALIQSKKQLGASPARRSRLWVSFGWSPTVGNNEARAFATKMGDQKCTNIGRWLLFDPVRGRKRLAVMAYRAGATVHVLEGENILVTASYWATPGRPKKGRNTVKPRTLDSEQLEATLERHLPKVESSVLRANQANYYKTSSIEIQCNNPSAVLVALGRVHEELGCEFGLYVDDIDPLSWSVRRLVGEVGR